ncbi:MAG TPA: hypothetical protein VLA13_05115 [Massilibacterium sp.]|nr:hypothetical protein [Massilibacterium sp.]
MDDLIGRIGVFVLVLVIIVAVSLLLGFPIMWLWNGLLPELFSMTTITYWQAVGLNLLSSLLIKSTTTKN